MDPRADRTELRIKLHENGFEPLANKHKMCLLTGWPTLSITPEVIRSREWARSREFQDTGIRCGGVVALDLDVDNKQLLNDLADQLIERGIVTESPFVRIGRPPREMWLYRIANPIGKRTTGAFAIPPIATTDPDQQLYATVEVLGKGSQFGAFGEHSDGVLYQWPGESLLDHSVNDLPLITAEQIERLLDFTVEFFEGRGMPRKTAGGTMDGNYHRVYDLVPEMVFNVKDLGPMSLGDLDSYLEANPDTMLRCTMETLRPSTGGSWAGMVSYVHGSVCISDHGDYKAHFPALLDNTSELDRLGALLAKRRKVLVPRPVKADEPPPPELDTQMPFEENMERALRRFVYVKNTNRIVDIVTNAPGYDPVHFKSLVAQHFKAELGPRGGEKLVMLNDAWLRSPVRANVAKAEMRPDKIWPLFTGEEGETVNTFRPVRLPSNGDPRLGIDLIERLLPRPEERLWFTQWLACKVHNPSVRGPGVVMVAHDTFGTGRGSLITLMSDMLGERYVRRIDFDTLTGRTYQSQYNEWMAESLLIAVDEAQEANQDRSKWQARQNAYERIKAVVDPNNSKVQINRKGVDNYQGTSFASLFVATNHADALVIPANDRRLAVLENGQAMAPDYWVRFHEWRAEPSNVGALIAHLATVDLAGYDPYTAPPMTAIKLEMIDSGTSDLDRAVRQVLKQAEGALMIREQLVLRVEDFMAKHSVEFPEEWRGAATRIFTKLTRKMPDKYERLPYDGMVRQLRQIRSAEGIFLDEESVLQELARNGPASRQMAPSNKVVKFPGPRAVPDAEAN